MINITERAAEEVKRIIAEQGDDNLHLRVRVVGGGCSGFQTKLDLDPEYTEGKDELIETMGIKVVVDKRSLLYIADASIDFSADINRRGFIVNNPSAKSTCGCGSSFDM